MRLSGKVAIVTGGGSGIGRAAAVRFAREGAAVSVADLSAASAQSTQAEIVRAGGRAIAVAGDLSRAEAVRALAERTAAELGAPTVLLNSAGITAFGTLAETDSGDLDRVLAVNVRSVWLCAQAIIPAMRRAGGGAIVNLALFLASDEASFITGSTYVIDGGALIARRWQE